MTPQEELVGKMPGEQMGDLLTGSETDGLDAEALRAALKSYRTESLLWAERRSAAMPSLAPAARRARVWAAVPQWSLAAVAAVTIAVGVVHYNNTSQAALPVEASATVAPATPQQIADDNALLNQIDAAVNAGSELPVDALGLQVKQPSASHGSME